MKKTIFALYRVRGPLFYGAIVVLVANFVFKPWLSQHVMSEIRTTFIIVAVIVVAVCVLLSLLIPHWLPAPPTKVILSPVQGRWLGVNSPASRIPSHGLRAYGQAYALDLVFEPDQTTRPAFGGPMMRSAREYPAFGQPVFSTVEGTVVQASDWQRDHRARSNWLGLFFLMIEGAVREIGGPGFIFGNYVTIRTNNGTYATIAHLQQRSLAIQVGDRVKPRTLIGKCGNSGNSSEPHVHLQLMDRQSLWTAQGLPMKFAGITLDEDPKLLDALPKDQQHMTTSPSSSG